MVAFSFLCSIVLIVFNHHTIIQSILSYGLNSELIEYVFDMSVNYLNCHLIIVMWLPFVKE